jgi:hypothetical protein
MGVVKKNTKICVHRRSFMGEIFAFFLPDLAKASG